MGAKAQSLPVPVTRRPLSVRSALVIAFLLAAAIAIALISFSWANSGGTPTPQKAPVQQQPVQPNPAQFQNPHAGAIAS